jgi:hypothetical protein
MRNWISQFDKNTQTEEENFAMRLLSQMKLLMLLTKKRRKRKRKRRKRKKKKRQAVAAYRWSSFPTELGRPFEPV